MTQFQTLPTFGEVPLGEGGRLGAIMRGALVDGVRQPDYAIIVADALPNNGDAGDRGKLKWGEYGKAVKGADSLTDGVSNTREMAAAGCPAALAVHGVSICGHQDWYIPSRAEMWALRANVPELFAKEWHWTSTHTVRHDAFVQDFAGGYSYWTDKGNEFRVRAVRRIHLQHFTA